MDSIFQVRIETPNSDGSYNGVTPWMIGGDVIKVSPMDGDNEYLPGTFHLGAAVNGDRNSVVLFNDNSATSTFMAYDTGITNSGTRQWTNLYADFGGSNCNIGGLTDATNTGDTSDPPEWEAQQVGLTQNAFDCLSTDGQHSWGYLTYSEGPGFSQYFQQIDLDTGEVAAENPMTVYGFDTQDFTFFHAIVLRNNTLPGWLQSQLNGEDAVLLPVHSKLYGLSATIFSASDVTTILWQGTLLPVLVTGGGYTDYAFDGQTVKVFVGNDINASVVAVYQDILVVQMFGTEGFPVYFGFRIDEGRTDSFTPLPVLWKYSSLLNYSNPASIGVGSNVTIASGSGVVTVNGYQTSSTVNVNSIGILGTTWIYMEITQQIQSFNGYGATGAVTSAVTLRGLNIVTGAQVFSSVLMSVSDVSIGTTPDPQNPGAQSAVNGTTSVNGAPAFTAQSWQNTFNGDITSMSSQGPVANFHADLTGLAGVSIYQPFARTPSVDHPPFPNFAFGTPPFTCLPTATDLSGPNAVLQYQFGSQLGLYGNSCFKFLGAVSRNNSAIIMYYGNAGEANSTPNGGTSRVNILCVNSTGATVWKANASIASSVGQSYSTSYVTCSEGQINFPLNPASPYAQLIMDDRYVYMSLYRQPTRGMDSYWGFVLIPGGFAITGITRLMIGNSLPAGLLLIDYTSGEMTSIFPHNGSIDVPDTYQPSLKYQGMYPFGEFGGTLGPGGTDGAPQADTWNNTKLIQYDPVAAGAGVLYVLSDDFNSDGPDDDFRRLIYIIDVTQGSPTAGQIIGYHRFYGNTMPSNFQIITNQLYYNVELHGSRTQALIFRTPGTI